MTDEQNKNAAAAPSSAPKRTRRTSSKPLTTDTSESSATQSISESPKKAVKNSKTPRTSKKNDAVEAPVAAKSTRSPRAKGVAAKKAVASDADPLAIVPVSSEESTKTPAKRGRKSTATAKTSSKLKNEALQDVSSVENVHGNPNETVVDTLAAQTAPVVQEELVSKTPRPRKTPVRPRKKNIQDAHAEKTPVEQQKSVTKDIEQNDAVMHSESQVQENYGALDAAAANSVAVQRSRSPRLGRPPKKARESLVQSAEPSIEQAVTPLADEENSQIFASKPSEQEQLPDVLTQERDKQHSAKKVGAKHGVKARKNTQVADISTAQEDVLIPIAKTSAQALSVHDDNAEMVVQADAIDTAVENEEASKASKRGRRGGRGRRGKKRTQVAQEGVIASEDNESENEEFLRAAEGTNPLPTSAQKHASATSLAEGKPGRARATNLKKNTAEVLGRRKMFVSIVPGEQVEVALVEEGAIHEYYLEMLHQAKTKGNIYKGIVHNIDTNLQAAFISYGTGKNGFLQIDEIHPEYFQAHHEVAKGKKYPPIQKVIKPGQEVLVQVVKEPTGNKGAFLTTWLSLPGRFLVLTPGQEQIGISRKVDNDEERSRLRELMTGIEPGEGLGVIVRTVSAGIAKTTLKNDLQYLKRIWREIRKNGLNEGAPALLYKEANLAERAIRDYLTDDICEVWVDNAEVAESLRETVGILFPRKKDLIRTHVDVRQTLWERFNIQRQLEQIYSREVVLPSGGRLVFDQTEALMAIDINSGKISGKGNFESMALKTNLEAAEAIARHLKLRDIGGQVVIDFIEMRDRSHVREVEKTLRNAMKSDRARHDVSRISSFGLLEIVRQRTGSSALAITMEPCPHCRGTGMRRNLEWQALQALREMTRQVRHAQNGKIVYETSAELAFYLLNNKRQRLCDFEAHAQVHVEVRVRA